MSLEVCYAAIGGDLEGVRGRLLTDERITKFVGIFMQDTSFQTLVESLENGAMDEAFRAAHTMKGISRDLGFTPLFEASSKLSDALRPGDDGLPAAPADVPELMQQTEQAYQTTIDAITNLLK